EDGIRDLYVTGVQTCALPILTLGEGILIYRALRRDNRVDGFVAYFIQDGVATGAILGYERSLPQGLGLYRMLFALLIAEAAQQRSEERRVGKECRARWWRLA